MSAHSGTVSLPTRAPIPLQVQTPSQKSKVLKASLHLAVLLKKQRQFDEAEELYRKVSASLRDLVLRRCFSFSSLSRKTDMYFPTLQVLNSLRPNSASAAISLLQLAELLVRKSMKQDGTDATSKLNEAGDAAARALKINDETLGPDHKISLKNLQVKFLDAREGVHLIKLSNFFRRDFHPAQVSFTCCATDCCALLACSC